MIVFHLSSLGVLGVDGDIYLTGGQDIASKPYNKASVYNIRSSSWETLSPMNSARHSHGMVMLENIYVIGGYSRGK